MFPSIILDEVFKDVMIYWKESKEERTIGLREECHQAVIERESSDV